LSGTSANSLSTPESLSPPDLHDQSADRLWGLKRSVWMQIGIVGCLFILLFWPNLRRLWIKTNPISGEPNWGHSVCVPLIGLYFLYVNRTALLAAVFAPLLPNRFNRRRVISSCIAIGIGLLAYGYAHFVMPLTGLYEFSAYAESLGQGIVVWGLLALSLDWGLGSMFFGLLTFAYGIWPGSNDYTKDLGMVITLFGTVLFLCGWGVMRITSFPIAFLVCALPLPPLLYSKIALPLQNLAAMVAVATLQMTGVSSFKFGTKITIGDIGGTTRSLNVAEACAGLRSLMTFITVGAAVAFLSNRPLWQKFLMTAMAVPIAIFCNVMRVTGQGLLDYYWSHELAEGFAHTFVGMVMLIPGFFLILGTGWLLDQLFIDDIEDPVVASSGNGARAAKPELVIKIPRPDMGRTMAATTVGVSPNVSTSNPTASTLPTVAPVSGVGKSAQSVRPPSASTPQVPAPPPAVRRPLGGVVPPPPASSPRAMQRPRPPTQPQPSARKEGDPL